MAADHAPRLGRRKGACKRDFTICVGDRLHVRRGLPEDLQCQSAMWQEVQNFPLLCEQATPQTVQPPGISTDKTQFQNEFQVNVCEGIGRMVRDDYPGLSSKGEEPV
jgi:hypothetical protein